MGDFALLIVEELNFFDGGLDLAVRVVVFTRWSPEVPLSRTDIEDGGASSPPIHA
jgi:hypothetical protein